MGASTSTLLAKLQHTAGTVTVLNAPGTFAEVLSTWRSQGLPVSQRRAPGSMFLLVFVRSRAEVEAIAGAVITSVGDDGILWFAYPKQGGNIPTDLSRDVGWDVLGRMGFESVRQIAIDDDWTALRFRHVDKIRNLQRDARRALTIPGRQRTRGVPSPSPRT